jgi:cytochrome c oxidase subunit 2
MKITFQDPITPVMYGISALHDHILFFLATILFVVIFIFVTTLIEFCYFFKDKKIINNKFFSSQLLNYKAIQYRIFDGRLYQSYINKKFLYVWSTLKSGVIIEIIWTIIPSLVLLLIAIPSFALLYAIDEIQSSSLFVKVIGHQWYWSYEVTSLTQVPLKIAFFDSYMLADSDLLKGELRLLKTDNALILPKNTPISVLITSDDVLHSWAIPACGVKVDAVPGRLSQICLLFKNSGVFYGQCSELCGVNHGFMPIELWVIDTHTFARMEMFLSEAYIR